MWRCSSRGCPEKLIIQFKVEGKPRANESYVLEIDEIRFRGTTDSDGVVAVFIPPDAEKGKIVFPDSGEEYPLELGDLDPITEITGVQGRLRNLGFYDGPVDGEVRDELARAISVFQERHNLEASGDLDESIRDAIQNAYGS